MLKPIHELPGAQLLTDYHRHGSGIDLFRAYLERRKADNEKNEKWRLSHLDNIPSANAESVFGANIFLNILDALDPAIQDIVRFCQDPGPVDDQLPNIRSALRIGKHRAPSDAEKEKRKWHVVSLWIQAYLKMQACQSGYKSETALKKEIASEAKVSESTALNHWKDLKKREPWQAKWAKEIAKRAKNLPVRPAAEAAKPTSRAPGKMKKLRFGKGV